MNELERQARKLINSDLSEDDFIKFLSDFRYSEEGKKCPRNWDFAIKIDDFVIVIDLFANPEYSDKIQVKKYVEL